MKHSLINAFKMAVITFISRIFGFIRTIFFSQLLGMGFISDAFFLAFKLPNLFRRSFAEGSMSSGFIPIFTKLIKINKKSEIITNPTHESLTFFHHIFTLFIIIMIILSSAFIFFSDQLIQMFYFLKEQPLTDEQLTQASLMVKIMFPYLLFISITSIFQGILNSYGEFSKPAFTPILFNIVIISISIYIFFNIHNIFHSALILSLSVTLGGISQAIFLYYHIRKLGYFAQFKLNIHSPKIKEFLKLFIPIFFSSSVYQINQILMDPLALYSGEGGLTALLYAIRIQELPLGIITVSLSTVFLTQFSLLYHQNKMDEMKKQIEKSITFIILIIIPIVLCILLSYNEIISIIFYSKAINQTYSQLISQCLWYQIIAIFPISLSRIYQVIFFSTKNTLTPMYYAIFTTIVNFTCSWIFIVIYKKDASFIALSSLISISIYSFLLYLNIPKHLKKRFNPSSFILFFKILIMSIISFYIIKYITHYLDTYLIDIPIQSDILKIKTLATIKLILKTITFIVILGFFLYLDKPEELITTIKQLKTKINKN